MPTSFFCIVAITTILCAATCVEAQNVDTLAQPVRSSVETVTCVDDKILMWSGRIGPILSKDGGDSYAPICSPEMVARVEKDPNVSFIAKDRIWLTGMDLALVLGSTGYETADGGETWTVLTPERVDGDEGVYSSGHRARKIDDDLHSRVASSFSTDRGVTWTHIPIPDSIGVFDLSNESPMIYDRSGVWCIRSQTKQRWYQTSLQEKRWVDCDVPFWITTFALLSDGSRVGVERVGQRSVLHRQVSRDRSWQLISFRLSDSLLLDTVSISKLHTLPDGSIATVINTGVASSIMAIINKDTMLFIQPAHIDTNYATIDVQLNGLTQEPVARDSIVLVRIGPRSGRPPRPPSLQCLVNVRSGAVEVLDRTASEISWQVLVNNELIAVRGRDAQIKYNTHTRRYIYGFALDDPWQRSSPIMFDGIVNDASGSPWLLTEWGDVGYLQDGRFMLVARNADKLNRSRNANTPVAVKRTAETEMRLGSNLIWSDGVAVYVGGAGLTRYDADGVAEQISSDTTTSLLVDTDGTHYRGYHSIISTTSDGLVDTLQVLADSNIVVGTFLKMNGGQMIAGLRGYRTVRDGQPVDTIPGGLYWSSDDGENWTQAVVELDDAPALLVHSIAQQPNSNILWASVTSADVLETTVDEGGVATVDRSIRQGGFSLLRSSDLGVTWNVVSTVTYGGSWLSSGSSVCFHSSSRMVWTTNNRILISDDGGISFVDADIPLSTQVGGVQFDQDGNLIAATSLGVLKVSLPQVSVDESIVRSTPAFWANTFPNPTNGRFTVRVYNIDRAGGRIDQLKIIDMMGRTRVDLMDRLGSLSNSSSSTIDVPVEVGSSTGDVLFLVASSPARRFIWPIWIAD